MRLGINYKVLLLVLTVLGVYYRAISGAVNSIDDVHIIEAYGVNGNLTLADILAPGGNFYFRPVVELTYYLDNRLWGMDASFMHLENILIHAVNTLLVFLVATAIAGKTGASMPHFPFLSALLFAVHPVNTEAVSWIAGRNDALATVFVLLSFYLLLKSLEKGRQLYAYLSVAALVFACLTKETAVFLLPVAFLMALFWSASESGSLKSAFACNRRLFKPFWATAAAVLILFACHLVLRGDTNSISKVLQWNNHAQGNVFLVALSALGFYVKKLFFPFPLNFAIVSIPSHYAWLGIAAVFALIPLVKRKNVLYVFFAIALLFIAPALVVAIAGISWTPVAERYLYLPSSFFSIGFVGSCYAAMPSINRHSWVTGGIGALIVAAACGTVQRNEVWQDNLALYLDAVEKSPDFGAIRNELAVALINKGRVAEGREQLKIAQRLNKRDDVRYLITLNQLALNLRDKAPEEARAILLQSSQSKKHADLESLNMLRKIDEGRLVKATDAKLKTSIAKEIIDTNEYIYARTNDPFCYYRNGQLSLMIGDRQKAAAYFRYAQEKAPDNAYYKLAAHTLADKLVGK